MNLKEIPDYEGLYSFDLNNNQVYGHKRKYMKCIMKLFQKECV